MRARHRIPSIFNLSMVDVLCCALGCVILLWLLNLRNATEKAAEAGDVTGKLSLTQEKMASFQQQFHTAQAALAQAKSERDQAQQKLDASTKTLTALQAEQAQMQQQLLALIKSEEAAKADAARLKQELQTATKDLTAARAEGTRLTQLLQNAEKELAAVRDERGRLDLQLKTTQADLAELNTFAWALQTQVGNLAQDLADTTRRLRAAEALVQDKTTLLATTQKDRDTLLQERDAAIKDRDTLRTQATNLNKLLEDARTQLKDATAQIALHVKNYTALDQQMTAAQTRMATLEKDLKDRDAQVKANAQRADSLEARLLDTEKKWKAAQAVADTVPGLEQKLKDWSEKYQKELALADELKKELVGKAKDYLNQKLRFEELQDAYDGLLKERQALRTKVAELEKGRGPLDERLAQLQRDLEKEKAAAEDLRKAQAPLKDQVATLQKAVDQAKSDAEARFAGVALSGTRVVFLVDMSGSMDRVDEKTPSVTKWQEVRENLAKVMHSIRGLEKYQVILFSTQVKYLLGQDGKWLDYDPAQSPKEVLDAMAKVTPKGGTNMYKGLDEAFKFRTQGLDTIYLLSDGLPNEGPGLALGQDQLPELKQSELMGKFIRNVLKTDWNKEQAGRPRVRINCIGFFYESPDLGAFLWALARENDGSFVGMSQP